MIALMSPVSPKEKGVNGMHCASPPPAADPFIFIVGPPDGCRIAAQTFLPRLPRPSTSPMLHVDLPSPSGVGVIAVTSMYLPSGLPARRLRTLAKSTFAT